MRRLLYVALALFVAVAVSSTISTDAATAQDLFGDAPKAAVAADPTDQAKQGKVDAKAKLQTEFMELSKARAEMMTEEELSNAIAEAKKVNNRIAARRELERAMAILGEIVDKHPDTPEGRAALRGKQALQVIEQPQDSGFARFPEDDPFGDLRGPVPQGYSRPYERSAKPGKLTKPEIADETEPFGQIDMFDRDDMFELDDRVDAN